MIWNKLYKFIYNIKFICIIILKFRFIISDGEEMNKELGLESCSMTKMPPNFGEWLFSNLQISKP